MEESMTVKGQITGNDAADSLIRHARMIRLAGSSLLAQRIEEDMPYILQSERRRTIASIRGRWQRRRESRASHMDHVAAVYAEIAMMLDEMEMSVVAFLSGSEDPDDTPVSEAISE